MGLTAFETGPEKTLLQRSSYALLGNDFGNHIYQSVD
jgi:hypothetical protein